MCILRILVTAPAESAIYSPVGAGPKYKQPRAMTRSRNNLQTLKTGRPLFKQIILKPPRDPPPARWPSVQVRRQDARGADVARERTRNGNRKQPPTGLERGSTRGTDCALHLARYRVLTLLRRVTSRPREPSVPRCGRLYPPYATPGSTRSGFRSASAALPQEIAPNRCTEIGTAWYRRNRDSVSEPV